MKRVLILAYFFPPSKAAGTFRTLRFVRHLPACGWRSIVLTVSESTYARGEQDADLLHKVPSETSVYRTPAPPMHRLFKRALQFGGSLLRRRKGRVHARAEGQTAQQASPGTQAHTAKSGSLLERIYTLCRTPDIDSGWYVFGLVRGLVIVWRQRPDVIYATGGPWTTFLIARDLARLTRLPLVLDYRDPWSFNPAAKRGGASFERLARRLEASAVRTSTRIVANTDVLRETLVKAHGVDTRDKTVVINNSFDEVDFSKPPPPQSDVFTLAYVGSLYEAHSPEAFLQALGHLLINHPEMRGGFRVRLVGSGAPRTAQLVREFGLEDVVEVQSPVSHAEAIRLQRSAHALLLFLTVPSEQSTFIPSKLFEYVAARRPIFAVTRGGALERMLRHRQLTPWIYSPDDLEGIATGLLELLERHERNCLPALSEDAAQSFSGAAAARALASVLAAAHHREPLAPMPSEAPSAAELESVRTEAT